MKKQGQTAAHPQSQQQSRLQHARRPDRAPRTPRWHTLCVHRVMLVIRRILAPAMAAFVATLHQAPYAVAVVPGDGS